MTRLRQALALLVVALFAGGGLLGLQNGSGGQEASAVAAGPGATVEEIEQDAASRSARSLLEQVVFEENLGQADEGAGFVARTASGVLLLGEDGLVFIAEGSAPLHLMFSDPSPDVVLEGVDPLASVGHHYIGPASEWVQGAPHFSQVHYTGLYPGIDLVVYATPDGQIEFDHVVAPGADPSRARYTVSGAPELEDGTLVAGDFRLQAPEAYQENSRGQRAVDVEFRLDGNEVSYALGTYDTSRPLVIDPVVTYSGYIGTSGMDYGTGVAVAQGASPAVLDLYVGGYVRSIPSGGFPPAFGTAQSHGSPSGVFVGFLAKMEYDRSTRTTTPQWIALIGGSGSDRIRDVAADAAGVALTGQTSSGDFPVMNPVTIPSIGFDGTANSGGEDAFAMRLDPSGALTFGTFLGGQGADIGHSVAIGPNGHILVAGSTSQPAGTAEFPTVNAPQPDRGGGQKDAFATKIDTSTTPASAVFSTFVGGVGDEEGQGVSEDATGVTVAGYILQTGLTFPTTAGAHQEMPDDGDAGFVTKIPTQGGSQWVYSTLLDGDKKDQIYDMETDSAGNAWVTGRTDSDNHPTTANAIANSRDRATDGFLFQISSDGSSILYGSYIGGFVNDYVRGLDLTPSGHVLLTGDTSSATGFPLRNATQPNPTGTSIITDEAFVVRVDATTGALDFGTYLGGDGRDYGRDIVGDDAGHIFVTGETLSTAQFPLVSAHQTSHGGNWEDGFLTIYGREPPVPIIEADASAFGHPVETTPLATPYTALTSQTILLDGSLSQPGDAPLDTSTVLWELKDGGSTLATDTGTWTPVFPGLDPLLSPTARVLEVCLTVEDTSNYPYNQATVCMDLEWQNRSPTGSMDCPASIAIGRQLVLTPTATDPEGEALTFTWDWGDGTTTTGDPGMHTYTAKGTYQVTMTVTDVHNATHMSTCEVTIIDGPRADFSFPAGELRMFQDIAFTDLSVPADQPIQTWTWDFGDGSTVVHHGSVPADFTHTFDQMATYTVGLTVFDGELNHTVFKDVTIAKAQALPQPDRYRAIVGEQLIVPTSTGVLANDIHPGNLPLTVTGHTQPMRADVAMHDDGSFTYTPTEAFVGLDTFTYHLTDGTTPVGPVTVEVEVASAWPPVADFRFTVSGTTVVFEDRTQAGDRPIASWYWSFSDGTDASGTAPFHTFPSGHHSATLHVTDTTGATSTMTQSFHIAGEVTATPTVPVQVPQPDPEPTATEAAGSVAAERANLPPTAVATGPETVRAGDEVRLDGTRSIDPDGDELTYRWLQVDGPPAGLQDADTASPKILAPWRTGAIAFELEVSDGAARHATKIAMEVSVPNPPSFHVEALEDGTYWFNATGSGGTWSFGDGTTAEGRSIQHRFALPGTYTVRLRADGAETVQLVEVPSAMAPGAPGPSAVHSDPAPDSSASVPEHRLPTSVVAAATGVSLLLLVLWAYRTWALVWIRVFTRVGRPEILDHPLRAQIHDAVQERPGIVLTDLVSLMDKGRRTVLHHVRMLEGAGMVAVTRAGGHTSLHPAGASAQGPSKEAVLRSEMARRLLAANATTPGMTLSALAKHLGVTQQTVSHHAARLESAGLVKKVKDGRATRLFTPEQSAEHQAV